MPIPLPASTPLPSDPDVSAAFVRPAQPRRILVYAPLAYSTPHYETDLEIAQRHIDLGDTVELALCDAELSSCQLNPKRDPQRCVHCVSRNLQGHAQLSAQVPVVSLLGSLLPEDHALLAHIPRLFPDHHTLRNYCFQGFDAGLATLSSVIDFARSLNVDTKQHATLIHQTLYAAASTFLSLRRRLEAGRYDRVYIYNGRWSMVRSAVRACEQVGVPYYTHERGSEGHKFMLFHNVLPHDKDEFRRRTQETWKRVQALPEAQAKAASFFQERRQRVEKTWFSFVKQQESGRIPADWNRDARRLVFFTSSEFEFAAIGDGATGRIYPTQVAGMDRIARRLATASPRSHLWIRVHPNDKSPHTVQRWKDTAAALRNVTLILPDESIDSYALLDGAERIMTFGSTMGIEATFSGKAAVCADFSFYDGLDAQYEAANEDDLIDLLTRADLPPKPRKHALCYGYYLNSFGGEFLHFTTEKISDYEFKSPFRGQCLRPDYNDLRQRLIALYTAGNFARAENIARLCTQFKPDDGLVQSIWSLTLIRRGQLAVALDALEAAVGKTTPAQFEQILKSTSKAVLDAVMQLGSRADEKEFRAIANRTGTLLQRSTTFAPIGQKLVALADRAPHAIAPQPIS